MPRHGKTVVSLELLLALKSDILKPVTPPVSRYRRPLWSVQLTVTRLFKHDNATPTGRYKSGSVAAEGEVLMASCLTPRRRELTYIKRGEGGGKCEGKLYLGHINYFGSTDRYDGYQK